MPEVSKEILFEKFEIIECLKKDVQAAVYLADHIYLGKKIILKSLNTKKIFDDSVIDRFKREAKLLAKLDHPNIIKVLDFGMYGDFFYISFEYFESKNLREYLKQNSLTLEQKEKLFVQILLGLQFAHSNKIIHRDIKPENVLVDESLHLKISDFGLALIQDDNFETSKYSIVGTPCYMSPEQVNGAKLTMQSDLFSLGSLAFELFTEKNLFLGNDVAQTINNIINFNGSSVDSEVEHLPENIKTVIKKSLKKNLNERLKNVEEILTFFNVQIEQTNTTSIPKELETIKKKSSAIYLAVASVAAVILVLISINFLGKSGVDNTEPLLNENKIDKNVNSSTTVKDENLNPENNNLELKQNNIESDNNLEKKDSQTPLVTAESPVKTVEYGKLSVECLPWADVYINNRKIDTTPIDSLLTFSVGEYNVKLIHPDYPEYVSKIKIERDKTTSVKVLLESLVGYLKCNVFPWGEVYVDNVFLGQTPLTKLTRLKKGNHEIKIKNPGFPEYVGNFTIKGHDTVEINFNFADRKLSIADNN